MTGPLAAVPTLDERLEEARATYQRLDVAETAAAVAAGGLLVDIRPLAQRLSEGEIPGALVVERNVLEWRFAPSSGHRLPEAPDPADERPVVIFCSEGYASSFAAASLRELGVRGATDLVGGISAWKQAGLPVEQRVEARTLPVAAV